MSALEPEGEKEAESGIPNTVGSRWVGQKTKEDGRELAREGDVESKGANSAAGESGLLPQRMDLFGAVCI